MTFASSSTIGQPPTAEDIEAVAKFLGRVPGGNFTVAARRSDGKPAVISNDPLLRDGTPMPTRYWLVDPKLRALVSRLEADGGVREAEIAVDSTAVADAHRRYRQERDALVPPLWTGARPSGGVGGTRQGIKCLHAHVAWWIAGGDDPVGAWAAERAGIARWST